MTLMHIGEKPDKSDAPSAKKPKEISPQKNNLMNYFGKK